MIKRPLLTEIRWILLVIPILLAACSKKQSGNQEIFSRYEGDPGVYIMKVPPSLLNSMAGNDSEVAENLKDAGKIDLVKVMVFNMQDESGRTVGEVSSEVREMTDNMGYDLMMSMSGGKTDVSVLMLESGETISDLLVIAREGETLTLVGLSGNLNADAIVELVSQGQPDSFQKGIFGFK
jgi:hypothetical protein